MGLSERKQKQRISYDPRNLTWSDDKDRFSYKHMKALGWTDASGIGGADLTGNAKHIAVVHKLDSAGIGMARAMKEGDEVGGQARAGLDDVLRRLASASASAAASANDSPSASPGPEVKPKIETDADVTPAKLRNRIASRQRHLQAKRLASSSPAALAEILGISASALPSPDVKPTIIVKQEFIESEASTPATGSPVRLAEDMVSTSTLSVSDYFRQKMRARAMARQGGSGEAASVELETPVASGSTTPVNEWQGTKMAFDAEATGPGLAFTESADDPIPGAASREAETKEERRAAKKAKKLEKEAKREAKAKRKAGGVDADDSAEGSIGADPSQPISQLDSKEARRAARKAVKAGRAGPDTVTQVEECKDGKKRKRV